jgi:hypothetical protein
VHVTALLVLVQVKNKRKKSMPRWPPGDGDTSRLGLMDPVRWPTGSSASRMVQEEQEKVMDIEPMQGNS